MKEEIKPMILITSSWEKQRTFKMIPLISDCIYNECIFDPEHRVLAIVSKEYKNNLQTINVLDDWGKAVPGKKERVLMDTYYEYFIEDEKEICMFIEKMALNSESYDYKRIIKEAFALIA